MDRALEKGKASDCLLFLVATAPTMIKAKVPKVRQFRISSLSIQAGHTCSFIFFTHPGKWFGIGPQWVQITEDTAIVIREIWANQDFASFHPQWRDAHLVTAAKRQYSYEGKPKS